MEIEKIVYGKIKHLNNQARLLHIGEVLSKVICDGKFIEEHDEDDDCEEKVIVIEPKQSDELDVLYKEFYFAYRQVNHYYAKLDEIESRVEEIRKQ